jgi:hypothetical protein
MLWSWYPTSIFETPRWVGQHDTEVIQQKELDRSRRRPLISHVMFPPRYALIISSGLDHCKGSGHNPLLCPRFISLRQNTELCPPLLTCLQWAAPDYTTEFISLEKSMRPLSGLGPGPSPDALYHSGTPQSPFILDNNMLVPSFQSILSLTTSTLEDPQCETIQNSHSLLQRFSPKGPHTARPSHPR